MPAIRDWTQTSTAGAATTQPGIIPNFAQNDLLIAILTADTSPGTWTATGWTLLFATSNTSFISVYWKIAGASEADPSFTHTTSIATMCHIISVRDVNTSSPFNGTGGAGTGYITATTSVVRGTMPSLTTTVNNSLILYLNLDSTASPTVPMILEGPVTYEAGDEAGSNAFSLGWSWGWKTTAGAVGPSAIYHKLSATAGILATIGISPPATGATVIPPICASDLCAWVDPVNGVTAYNSNTAFAATATTYFSTTLNGRPLGNGTVAAATDVGLNSYHSMGQLTGGTTNRSWAGATLLWAAGNRVDVTNKNVLIHVKTQTPKVLQNTDAISRSGTNGVAIGMASGAANTNYRVWHVHGAGTAWNPASHIPVVINSGNAGAGRIQNTGTLAPTSITAFGFFVSGTTVAPVWQFGAIWVLDVTTICGGNAAGPLDLIGVGKIAALGKERMSVMRQGANQALVLQPLQFGNGGTDPLYMNLDGTVIEFPRQYDVASEQVFYNSIDNAVGITYFAGASDTIIHTNAVITSQSRYYWGFNASSSASASYDFRDLTVSGAGTITLVNNVNLTGVIFTACNQITKTATNTMTSCVFSRSAATSGQGAISITGASQAALQTALDKLSSCSFVNNTVTGTGALRIIYTGTAAAITLNCSSLTFSGNHRDILWDAPASSPLTFKQTSVANASTSTATNSNTVTIQNIKTLLLNNIITGSKVFIYRASDNSLLASTDSGLVTSSDPEHAGQQQATYTYAYTTSFEINIVVLTNAYLPLKLEYPIPSADTTIKIEQQLDRQYTNPA